jgi:hypothetical protein
VGEVDAHEHPLSTQPNFAAKKLINNFLNINILIKARNGKLL